jgi:predicted CXXCH cytochrome family protein
MSRMVGMKMTMSGSGWWRWMVLVAVVLSAAGTVTAGDSGQGLTEEAQECFECHEDESLEKNLTNGETLSLNVDGDLFLGSAHGAVDCTSCHRNVVLDDHPDERAVESREAHRAEISTSCRRCHSDSRLQELPVHFALVSQPDAPACASCHAAHTIRSIDEWKTSLDDSSYCLTCHSRSIRASFSDGVPLALTMDVTQLRESVHLDHDCTDCHQTFGKDAHAVREFSDRREHSLALAAVCRECHDDMYEQYEGSIHFSIIAGGNVDAPVCTDCHGSHFVNPVATLETIAGVPCRRCHQEIFDSYAESMHGQARGAAGHIEAPICADCHRAHGVQAASWTGKFKATCLSCHDDLEAVHGVWLPNAGLHLDVVACPSCHAPEAERRIDLALFNRGDGRLVTDEDLQAHFGDSDIPRGGGDGAELSAVDLWRYIRETNGNGSGRPIVLTGQLEVKTGIEAHRMTGKEGAVATCSSCHLKGAEAFRTVTMSLVESDGRVRHVQVDDKVLGSVTSMGSLGGFYVLGSTRIGLLDILLIMAVLGGMSVPAMHMTARLLARQKMGREGR